MPRRIKAVAGGRYTRERDPVQKAATVVSDLELATAGSAIAGLWDKPSMPWDQIQPSGTACYASLDFIWQQIRPLHGLPFGEGNPGLSCSAESGGERPIILVLENNAEL